MDDTARERDALRRVVQTMAVMAPDALARAIAVLMARRDAEAHRATQAALDAMRAVERAGGSRG